MPSRAIRRCASWSSPAPARRSAPDTTSRKCARNHDRVFIKDVFERCSRLMLSLTRLPQPVIARVHGIVAAAGCQLVAQCDLAVAADDARFADFGHQRRAVLRDPGVALSRNVPRKRAMEMLMTGEFIDAAAALSIRIGQPRRADGPTGRRGRRLAQSIIAKTPVAVAAGKKLFYGRSSRAGTRLRARVRRHGLQHDDGRCGRRASTRSCRSASRSGGQAARESGKRGAGTR